MATSGNETQVIDEASDLGFVMMGARPYLADLGRFTSADPTHGSDLNPYSYANNDPINQADPSGQAASQQTAARYFGEPGELVAGILVGVVATSYFLPSAALALLSAFDLSVSADVFLAGAGVMVGGMVVAAGVGMPMAYGISKALGIPVSPLKLGIGALAGEVGGLAGFWVRMAYGLRSSSRPPVVDVDETVTDSGPVQSSVYPEPVDYGDMGDLQSLEESSEGGALGDLAGSGGDVVELDDIADLDEALEAMAVLLGTI